MCIAHDRSKLNLLRMFIGKGATFDYFCNFSQVKFENDGKSRV